MDDDEEDANPTNTIFSSSSISDLVSGRGTLFCCLCCGIPYSLPNDAYIYRSDEIHEFIEFTHRVRKQVGLYDRTRGSTMQWHLNLAHYLHRSVLHLSPSS